jgi:hypothetical protein
MTRLEEEMKAVQERHKKLRMEIFKEQNEIATVSFEQRF